MPYSDVYPMYANHQLRVKVIGLLIVASVSFCSSCNIPLGDLARPYKGVSHEPNGRDLVGLWLPDQDTINDMRERGGYDVSVPTRISLIADGTFEMANMPDWWSDSFGQSHRGFQNSSGNWKLSNSGGYWNIDLRSGNSIRMIGLVEHKTKAEPQYYIQVIIGDPDSGDAMIFMKKM